MSKFNLVLPSYDRATERNQMVRASGMFFGKVTGHAYTRLKKCELGNTDETKIPNGEKQIYIPYFLKQFPQKLFFFEFVNPKVTLHIRPRSQYIKVQKLFKGGKLYEEIRYTDFSPYYLTHREVACIFVLTQALPVDLRS